VPETSGDVSELLEKLACAETELRYQRTAMKQVKSEVSCDNMDIHPSITLQMEHYSSYFLI